MEVFVEGEGGVLACVSLDAAAVEAVAVRPRFAPRAARAGSADEGILSGLVLLLLLLLLLAAAAAGDADGSEGDADAGLVLQRLTCRLRFEATPKRRPQVSQTNAGQEGGVASV